MCGGGGQGPDYSAMSHVHVADLKQCQGGLAAEAAYMRGLVAGMSASISLSRNRSHDGSSAVIYFVSRDRAVPNTSSAEETLPSSILSPSRTQGKWSGHSTSASLVLRVALSWPWALSTNPLLWGVVGRVVYELYSQQLMQACPKD
jgi:hypothetical protein